MGERTPHLDANARAAWVGLTAKHQASDLVRVDSRRRLLQPEGWSRDHRELGARPATTRSPAAGQEVRSGISYSPNIFNQRVTTLETQEGSAFGAALLAAIGTGDFGSARKHAGGGS